VCKKVDMMESSFVFFGHEKERTHRYLWRGEVQWRDRFVNKQWFGGQRSQQSVPGLTRSRVEEIDLWDMKIL